MSVSATGGPVGGDGSEVCVPSKVRHVGGSHARSSIVVHGEESVDLILGDGKGLERGVEGVKTYC